MEAEALSAEDIARLALRLTPKEKVQLIQRLAYRLQYELADVPATPAASPATYFGVLAHLGPAPSAEEIDEARHEMWGDWMSPRDKA